MVARRLAPRQEGRNRVDFSSVLRMNLTARNATGRLLVAQAVAGACVLVVIAGIIFITLDQGVDRGKLLYRAYFNNVGELTLGSSVRVSGVEVGKVSLIRLAPGKTTGRDLDAG